MSHITLLKEVVVQPIQCLRNEAKNFETKRSQALSENLAYAFISELREELIKQNSVSRRFRRVFVESDDMADYVGVGWVLCDDVDFCMVCSRTFNMLFDPQLHCHACGNIICSSCAHGASVHELRKLGLLPVCKFCDWGQVRKYFCYYTFVIIFIAKSSQITSLYVLYY
jgi:hypothetical protein